MSQSASDKNRASYDYTLIAQAWHEAGHTICALFNFFKIESVYVMKGKATEGWMHYEICDISSMEPELVKTVVMHDIQTLYAGMMAEKIYYKEACGSDKFPRSLRDGWQGDLYEISNLIKKNKLSEPGKQRANFKQQIQSDVTVILSEYWSDVRLVAHHLYNKRNLTYRDIRSILTNYSENAKFWIDRFNTIKKIYKNEKCMKRVLKKSSVALFS